MAAAPFAHALRTVTSNSEAAPPPSPVSAAKRTVRLRLESSERIDVASSPLVPASVEDDPLRLNALLVRAPAEPLAPPPRRPFLDLAVLKAKALKEAAAYPVVLNDAMDASEIYVRTDRTKVRQAPVAARMPWTQFEALMMAKRLELNKQWDREDRGKALSTAAALAHLLSRSWADADAAPSYAGVWLVVVDVLLEFAGKVHAYMITAKANEESRRNWQTRVLGLPGLVQRLYMSTCLGLALDAVVAQTVGIADPVVACHVLAFVALHATVTPALLISAARLAPNAPANRFARLALVSRACQVGEETWFAHGGLQVQFPAFFELSFLVASTDAVQRHATDAVNLLRGARAADALLELVALRLSECGPTPPVLLSQLHALLGDDARLAPVAALVELASLFQPERAVLQLVKEYERRLRFAAESEHGEFTQRVIDCVVARCGGQWDKVVSSDAFLRLFESLNKSAGKLRLGLALLSFPRDPAARGGELASALAVARGLHDCLNAASFDDERREVTRAVCAVVTDLARRPGDDDAVASLVDCRASFYKTPAVYSLLVRAAWVHAERTKTAGAEHVATLLAFCLATIPSVPSAFTRGVLYARTGLLAHRLQRPGLVATYLNASLECLRQSPTESLLAYVANVVMRVHHVEAAASLTKMPTWTEPAGQSIVATLKAWMQQRA